MNGVSSKKLLKKKGSETASRSWTSRPACVMALLIPEERNLSA